MNRIARLLAVVIGCALFFAPAADAAAGGAAAPSEHTADNSGGVVAMEDADDGWIDNPSGDEYDDGVLDDGEAPTPGTAGGVTPGQPLPRTVDGTTAPADRIAAPTTTGGPIRAAAVPYGKLIATTARRHGIPVALFTALVWQESGFKANARSHAGARGLTQLMPGTARYLGVKKIYDPAQNLAGGARYLREQLVRFRSKRLALAAYNAGPGAVAKHRGVPPYTETRNYVKRILAFETRLTKAGVR